MDEKLKAQIESWFTPHPAKGDQRQRYDLLTAKAKEFAIVIAETTPRNADQTVAIRKLHESLMEAISAIACGEP